jgi:hypothetical protein
LRALPQSPVLLDGSEGAQEQYGRLLRKLSLSTPRFASAWDLPRGGEWLRSEKRTLPSTCQSSAPTGGCSSTFGNHSFLNITSRPWTHHSFFAHHRPFGLRYRSHSPHCANFKPMRSEAKMECSRSERRIALGPLLSRRAAQGFAGARDSAPQHLTSGSCLNAAAAGRFVSSARPEKTEQRRAVGPRPTGEEGALLFGDFLLGKQEKVTALSGAHPDSASRSEQDHQRDSGTRLRSAKRTLS